jgi:hypothetical protein
MSSIMKKLLRQLEVQAGILVIILILVGFKTYLNKNPQVLPSPLASAAKSLSSPSPEPPKCLAEDNVSQILGHKFTLLREEFTQVTATLECSYQADTQLRDVTPRIEYSLHLGKTDFWQQKKDQFVNSSNFRAIPGHENIFAVLNPIAEVRQATFYARGSQGDAAVTFTPVEMNVDELLNKGAQVSQVITQ